MNAFVSGCRYTGRNQIKMSFHTRKTSHIKTRLRQVKFTTDAEDFQEKYKSAVAPLHNTDI